MSGDTIRVIPSGAELLWVGEGEERVLVPGLNASRETEGTAAVLRWIEEGANVESVAVMARRVGFYSLLRTP